MRIFKFYENKNDDVLKTENDNIIYNKIHDIISNEIYTQDVKFSDDVEISPKSIENATKSVLKYLKKVGVDFDVIFNSNKYNL